MTELRVVDRPFVVATEIEGVKQSFFRSLRMRGRAVSTLEKYEAHLETWAEWLRERGITTLEQLNQEILWEWGAGLNPAWSPATVRLAISVVRSFLSWCRKNAYMPTSFSQVLEAPPVKARLERTLSEHELELLLNQCDLSTSKGQRDAALVSLLLDTGLRASEICRLRVEDVHFDVPMWADGVNFVTVIVKGGDEKAGFFEAETASYLKAWLETHPARSGVRELFISVGGNTPGCGLTRHGLRNILKKLGKQAGVAGVSPHAFRRSFACLLSDAGASDGTIMKLGRWSDIKLVQRYTQAREAGKQFSQFSPMRRLRAGREMPDFALKTP